MKSTFRAAWRLSVFLNAHNKCQNRLHEANSSNCAGKNTLCSRDGKVRFGNILCSLIISSMDKFVLYFRRYKVINYNILSLHHKGCICGTVIEHWTAGKQVE